MLTAIVISIIEIQKKYLLKSSTFLLLYILPFNFLNKGLAFGRRFPLAWLGLPTGCHEFGPLFWGKTGIESPAASGGLRPIIALSNSSK